MKKKPAKKDEPIVRHLERAGRLTTAELVCLTSLQESMRLIQEAHRTLIESIAEHHNIPNEKAWKIMPNGEIGLEDRG